MSGMLAAGFAGAMNTFASTFAQQLLEDARARRQSSLSELDRQWRSQEKDEERAFQERRFDKEHKIKLEDEIAKEQRSYEPDLRGEDDRQLTRSEAKSLLESKNKAVQDTDAAQNSMFQKMQEAKQAEGLLSKADADKDIVDKLARTDFEKEFGVSDEKGLLISKLEAAKKAEDSEFDKALAAAEIESKASEKIHSEKGEERAFKDKEAAEKRTEDAANRQALKQIEIEAANKRHTENLEYKTENDEANRQTRLTIAEMAKAYRDKNGGKEMSIFHALALKKDINKKLAGGEELTETEKLELALAEDRINEEAGKRGVSVSRPLGGHYTGSAPVSISQGTGTPSATIQNGRIKVNFNR